MIYGRHISLIMPALDEERSIGHVLAALPGGIDDIVVVDNGSSDRTAEIAAKFGARIVDEPRRGYGQACLTGIAALGTTDIVVFLDADFSDDPPRLGDLVRPIAEGHAEMVLGQRLPHAAAALTLPQHFGNRLACYLMRIVWGHRYRDLGPFRAIDRRALDRLGMADTNYGWTVEMQIKAVEAGLEIEEIDVDYRPRIGRSKISGTVRGVICAGTKILWTIARYALSSWIGRHRHTAYDDAPRAWKM